MSKGQRRRYTAEQKAELLRQHVSEKKPVSEVCSEAQIVIFQNHDPGVKGLPENQYHNFL